MRREAVERSIVELDRHIQRTGLESFDPHDLLSTRLGQAIRRGFYTRLKWAYVPAAAALYGVDLLAPSVRSLLAEPTVSAEAVAYVARAKLDLRDAWRDERQLAEAIRLLDWLEENSIPGYSGPCWGLPFDWQTASTLVAAQTPCVTITCTVALLMLDATRRTGISRFAAIGRAAAGFVERDLGRVDRLVTYTPVDSSRVVNANAYAADLLLEVGWRTSDEAMIADARNIIAAVLDAQGLDGLWPYYFELSAGEANFIDCLHTCFVLESLVRVYGFMPTKRIEKAIARGVGVLIDKFVGEDGSCRHYLDYHSPHLVRADARSCAEAVRCLCLADNIVPGAGRTAVRVAEWSIDRMQLRDGSFRHRIFAIPTPPAAYHRWSNGPMLAALAALARRSAEGFIDDDLSDDRDPAEVSDVAC